MKLWLTSFCLLVLWSTTLFGQIYNPVSWDQKTVKTGNETYDIIYTATIEDGWYIYSQYLEGEDGPIPTSFNLDEGAYSTKGEIEECDLNKKEVFDKLFDMNLVKYGHKAIFRQTIKTASPKKPITGYLEFMVCDEEKCLPPAQIDFELDLSKSFKAEAIKYKSSLLCKDQVKFVATSGKDQKSDVTQSDPKKKTVDGVKTESKIKSTSSTSNKLATKSSSSISAIQGLPENNDDGGIEDPVKWTAAITRKENGNAVLEMKADIEKGWHIYSTNLERDDGPIRTTVNLEESPSYAAIGKVKEESDKVLTENDKFFGMKLTKLKKNARYTQLIDVKNEDEPIKGFLEYMACTSSKCLTPQYVDFEANAKSSTIRMGEELMEDAGLETGGVEMTELEKMYALAYEDLQEPMGACVDPIEEDNSLWTIFVLGFLGGLIALLTPCVFPMIPLTVSFFTKSSEKKGNGLFNAIFYGLSILLVYVLISVPFHLLDSVNPNILNDISTNMWLNIAFFLIFLFFAFSFFGYFDLTIPASVTNRISAAEGVGGVLGIFFMALTLALVSFSCTGPILGSLLAGSLSSDGGAWELTSGFSGFGLALGLPFGLFAAFPSMMNSLPKSGGWLNTVKVVLGFLELALAFKFLSNADLVKQWGILKIEPFLLIWIAVAIGMGLYLIGKIKFPHDSPIKKLSFGRISFAVLSFAFAVYLISGFRTSERTGSYQPLSLLSGLAPPVCYSFVHECKCPQGLECFKDLKEGLAYAKKVNKPVLLDFTGHACVNCRKMEEHVWPEKEVYTYLENDYVLISLYVDEKIALPEEDQVVLPMRSGGSQKMRYTGNRWSYLQTEYFNNNSQPYYVLMTPDGQLLNNPVGYTPDKDLYAEFLACGLRNYEQVGEK